MSLTRLEERNEKDITGKFKLSHEKSSLYRRTWWNWFLLAGILIITTIGLATAILPLLSERIEHPWPWVGTDFVLLVGLSLIVLAFVGYMTHKQRRDLSMHKKLQQLMEESEKRMHQYTNILYAATSISHIMGAETDLQTIFNYITKLCVETFNSYRTSLMLLDKENMELVVKSVYGRSDKEILETRQKIGEGISGWVAVHREPLLLGSHDNGTEYYGLKLENPFIVSAMVVPIIVRDELVGVLNVSSQSPDVEYDEEDLRALQIFAKNVGTCIRHMEHVHWTRQMVPHLREARQDKKKHKIP